MSHISVFKTPGPLKLGKAHDDEKIYTIVIIPTEKRTQPDIFSQKDRGWNGKITTFKY